MLNRLMADVTLSASDVALGQSFVHFLPSGLLPHGNPLPSNISPEHWRVWLAALWLQSPGRVNKRGIKLGISATTSPFFPLDFFHELQQDHMHACFIGPLDVVQGITFYVYGLGYLALTDILHATCTYEVMPDAIP